MLHTKLGQDWPSSFWEDVKGRLLLHGWNIADTAQNTIVSSVIIQLWFYSFTEFSSRASKSMKANPEEHPFHLAYVRGQCFDFTCRGHRSNKSPHAFSTCRYKKNEIGLTGYNFFTGKIVTIMWNTCSTWNLKIMWISCDTHPSLHEVLMEKYISHEIHM